MDLSRFLNLIASHVTPFVLRCAVDLEISDHIHAYAGDAMPLNELSRAIPIAPEKELMLGQIMRLLVHLGVFAESDMGYILTPVSELMLTKGANMGAYVRLLTDHQINDCLYVMGSWLKSSDVGSIYQMNNEGKSVWESTKEMPVFGNILNEAMASHSRVLLKEVITSCPQLFERLKSLVDVGGGIGTAVEIIAKTFPRLKCTVFDLPHVIANVRENELFDAMGGNMFEKVPPADAVLLKNVLHDWPDEDCIKILKRCEEAISSIENDGKIIIIEITVDLETHDRMAIETSLCWDVGMMAAFRSKERSKQEWLNIFQAAGFFNYKVHAVGIYAVYELFP